MAWNRYLQVMMLTLAALGKAHAQIDPGIGGAPPSGAAVPGVPGAPAAAPAGAAPPQNLWGFLVPTAAQKQACKDKCCQSPIFQFLNAMTLPAASWTGGMIGPICPPSTTPNANDLQMPSDSAQGAAAKIKQSEAQAKARIAALQYLGTVDCRYFPEAEAAIINGLRADTNECVRATAAKVLIRGCCCTDKVVKALTICVSNSNSDGHPAERSQFVLAFAYVALDHCLQSCMQAEPGARPENPPERPELPRPEIPPVRPDLPVPDDLPPTPELPFPKKQVSDENLQRAASRLALVDPSIEQAGYYALVASMPRSQVYSDARAVLARGLNLSRQTMSRLSHPGSLKEVLVPQSADSRAPAAPTSEPAMATNISETRSPRSIKGAILDSLRVDRP